MSPGLFSQTQAGNSEVLCELGIQYLRNYKYKAAKQCFQGAISAGNPRGYYEIARIYMDAEQYDRALQWLSKAVERSYTPASHLMGLIYLETGNESTGLDYLIRSYQQAYSGSCLALGSYYDLCGEERTSREWYQRGVATGDHSCMMHLAELAMQSRDFVTALEWLRVPAEADNAEAHYKSGLCLEYQQNISEAISYYQSADALGHISAKLKLGGIYDTSDTSPEPKDIDFPKESLL